MAEQYITPEGRKLFIDEYDQLMKVERPKVTVEVRLAAEMGDRSENAEYIYGKKRLREIDRRMGYLQRRLEATEVVDPSEFSPPVIRFGAYVEIEDNEGNINVYRIVGKDEIDSNRGWISYQSPMGKALIGRENGDEMTIRTPLGARTVEVLSVSYNSMGTT
jgi:transcription elongation factor GreB